METDRLIHFCAVVDTGQINLAAEILGITSGGLSKSIKILESELGVELFIPKGRGIEITPTGEKLYSKARHIVQQIEELKKKEGLNQTRKILRIGVPESLGQALIGPLYKRFENYDCFQCIQLDASEIGNQIISTQIDFGLTIVPYPTKNLSLKKLCPLEFNIYTCNRAHLDLTIEDLPFVIPYSDLPLNLAGFSSRDGWSDEKIQRKVIAQTSHISLALQILLSHKAAIYLPSLYEKLFKDSFDIDLIRVSHFRSKKSQKKWIYLCHRSNEQESKEMKAVASLVRQLSK